MITGTGAIENAGIINSIDNAMENWRHRRYIRNRQSRERDKIEGQGE